MNMLLFLILIAAGEAAYFETTVQTQAAAGFQEQESAWQTQDDLLHAEKKQLTASRAGLLRNINEVKNEITNLNGEILSAKANVPAVTTPPVAGQQTAQSPADTSSNTSLGTIATKAGQTFLNCQLLKVEPDGITFSHSEGITKVLYPYLPDALQKRFNPPGAFPAQ